MTQMEGHDGSTVITMYRPKMLQVRVDTRFEDIPKVSLGQTVEIGNACVSLSSAGNRLVHQFRSRHPEEYTLQVKVAIPDPPDVFKPEMLVDVTFLAPERSERCPITAARAQSACTCHRNSFKLG